MDIDLSSTKNILNDNRPQLHGRANVVATGIGYKISQGKKTSTVSIVCSVVKKLPASKLSPQELVPKTLNGIPTDVMETGRIRAFQAPTDRYRPAPGGVSIGHRDITAGTLGCLVKKNGEVMILSNNHVLANSNDAQPGDAILQPGPYDGGTFPNDHIADLHEFVPILFLGPEPPNGNGCSIAGGVASFLNSLAQAVHSNSRLQVVRMQAGENLVDAAIARPLNEQDVIEEIREIGTIQVLAEGELGLSIKKSGRTTELTSGEVLQTDVTVSVSYGTGRTASFTDQLMAGAMSQGGDSGSAVLDTGNNLIGLLFAGSDNSTIINRIQNVFSVLGLSL